MAKSNLWPEWKALNAPPSVWRGHTDPKNCCRVTETEKQIYFNFHFNLLMRMGKMGFNGWQNDTPCCCWGVLGQFAAIIAEDVRNSQTGDEGKWGSALVQWLDNGSSVQRWHEPWAAVSGHKDVFAVMGNQKDTISVQSMRTDKWIPSILLNLQFLQPQKDARPLTWDTVVWIHHICGKAAQDFQRLDYYGWKITSSPATIWCSWQTSL